MEFLHKVLKLAKIRQITFVVFVVKYIITQLRSVRRVVTFSFEEKKTCLYFQKKYVQARILGRAVLPHQKAIRTSRQS